MDRIDNHANEVLKWREAISTLPDNHFFDLIRMYIGEVKTPYNKQKLIEQLSAFIRKDENKKNLFKLLSITDILIISAIIELPTPTQKILAEFFENTFGYANLLERLMNLEERLIIFKWKDDYTENIVYKINPLISEELQNSIDVNILLKSTNEYDSFVQTKKITPSILSAFFTFIINHSNICKTDGTIKKKYETLLLEIFPQQENILFFQYILISLENLNLAKNNDGCISLDMEKVKNFCALSEIEQYCYLCAASTICTRTELFRRAKLVYDVLSFMQDKAYEKSILFRIIFLQNEKTKNNLTSNSSYFASLLAQHNKVNTNPTDESSDFIYNLINNAVEFNLLQKTHSSVDDRDVYIPINFSQLDSMQDKKTVSIDGGFNITIMPGSTLQQLFSICQCLELRHADTVSSYEITRQSCMKSFDNNLTPQKIIENFNKVLIHKIPDVLINSLEEWFKNYSSTNIYKGFILQVDKEKQILVEKNPYIEKHIKQIFASGIYLMDFESDEEANSVIAKSGLDFVGKIKTSQNSLVSLPFQKLQSTKMANKLLATESKKEFALFATDEEKSIFFDNMRKELANLQLTQEQNEGLQSRIQRKIILSPSQLKGESVKPEKIEAGGMDFQGKIHIIEYAISTQNLIELVYDNDNFENGKNYIVGQPLSIEKNQEDAIVKLQVEPKQYIENFSISKAKTIKRIRGSIFRQ